MLKAMRMRKSGVIIIFSLVESFRYVEDTSPNDQKIKISTDAKKKKATHALFLSAVRSPGHERKVDTSHIDIFGLENEHGLTV